MNCENIKDTDTMELVALQRENAELKDDNKVMADNYSKMEQKFYDNLTKAKFLLKQLVDAFPKSYSDVVKDTLDEARKFVEE